MGDKPRGQAKDEESGIPDLVEKVQFWQEQDKINQALIPRIARLAEELGNLTGRVDVLATRQEAYEATTPDRRPSWVAWLALALSSATLIGLVSYLFLGG